ncbi:MAG: PA2779 family protein [Thermodesulfobacteriota bacterium]
MRKKMQKGIIWYLVVAMFLIGTVPRAYGAFSPSEIFSPSSGKRATDLQKVKSFLERKIVAEKLKELGFSPQEIQKRIHDLNDQQIHQLALKIDEWKVGGDSGLGLVIAILIIAILIVLFLQLTGHRIVVK